MVLDVGIVVKLDCIGEMSIWRAQLVSNLQDLPEDAIWISCMCLCYTGTDLWDVRL